MRNVTDAALPTDEATLPFFAGTDAKPAASAGARGGSDTMASGPEPTDPETIDPTYFGLAVASDPAEGAALSSGGGGSSATTSPVPKFKRKQGRQQGRREQRDARSASKTSRQAVSRGAAGSSSRGGR